jgi:hypothetical protein
MKKARMPTCEEFLIPQWIKHNRTLIRDLEQANTILTNWQSQKPVEAYCQCSNGHSTMLPMAEIQQTPSGLSYTFLRFALTVEEEKVLGTLKLSKMHFL